jgi:hypothetical protein
VYTCDSTLLSFPTHGVSVGYFVGLLVDSRGGGSLLCIIVYVGVSIVLEVDSRQISSEVRGALRYQPIKGT